MRWDIVIFNSKQRINSIEEIREEFFVDIDFDTILERHFPNMIVNEGHRQINGENYSIEYFSPNGIANNLMLSLHGEQALFELIRISKIYDWQIFDTGNGQMLDINHPEINGYNDFQAFLKRVIKENE